MRLLRLALLLPALLAVACAPETTRESPATSGIKTEAVELRVDDAVLAGNDVFAIVEPAWWSANIYGSLRDYEKSLEPFSRPQRLLVALQWYIAEVNNGGHSQFYSNSTGIVWPDAIAAFEEIGVPEGAAIIRESVRRFGADPSRDREERNRQLERIGTGLDDLDDRFFKMSAQTNLDAYMLAYARSRPADFHFSGTVQKPVP